MSKKKLQYNRIIQLLQESKRPLGVDFLSTHLDLSKGYTRKLLNDLSKTGQVHKSRGRAGNEYVIMTPEMREIYQYAYKNDLLDVLDLVQVWELIDKNWSKDQVIEHLWDKKR